MRGTTHDAEVHEPRHRAREGIVCALGVGEPEGGGELFDVGLIAIRVPLEGAHHPPESEERCRSEDRQPVPLDESVSQHGFPTLSRYVEWYWLPILGPTALLALRRMVSAFEWYSNGYESHVEELASSLGLTYTEGTHNPFTRAVSRLMYFGIVRGTAHSLAVRTHLPLVPTTHLQRLHPGLRASHDVFVSAERKCAARPSCP